MSTMEYLVKLANSKFTTEKGGSSSHHIYQEVLPGTRKSLPEDIRKAA